LLSANYWGVDFVYDERRAILDQSFFPREPTQLPLLLSALTGVSTSEEIDVQQASDTMADVYDYLHELPYVTILSPPLSYTIIGSENGHSIVEAAIDIDLPGAVTIPRRTRGVIAQTNDGENPVIEWRFHQSAWPLLVEILRGAAGFSPNKARDPQALSLSLVELGVQGDLSNILSAGLKLIRCVLRSPDVANRFITEVSSAGEDFAGHALLDLALTVACDRTDMVGAQHAIEILQSLLLIGSPEIWQAFRAIGFFDSHMRRKGSIAGLIQSDAMRGQHGLTLALLRLVRSIATANAGDPVVVRAAIKLIVTEVWSQFSGWRYRDVSERYKIAALIADIFDTVLRHPLGEDGKTHSPAAAYLIDIFISSASLLTYKPIVDVFTQSESLATRLIQSRRWVDADAVLHTFDQAASLLATLVRIASSLSIPTSALPYSAFASTVVLAGGDKVRFVDALFDLIPEQTLQPSSLRLVIRLLKVYLETATRDASRPSLAGMLRDAAKTCEKVAAVAFNSALNDVKPDAWALLGVIIATQPGCAFFCFGTPLDKQKADDKNSDKGKQKEGEPAKAKITGPLKMAVDETLAWDDLMTDGPRALAAILAYLQSVIECPSASTSVSALRTHPDFWKAVYDISIKNVPLPSSFSERIALDVQDYSYRMQAKANATALLAAELVLVLDTDGPETKAQTLALSLFRNASLLEDVVVGTIHSSCDPELQNGEQSSLSSNRVHLAREQTVCLRSERDYGVDYLFDGKPVILNDPDAQAAVLRSLAILNMNWSQLDADVSYTKAWRTFAEVVSTWTAGDALAAKATLKAANAAAALLAQEDRGGDVMLAIQTERLGILSTLLETALDPESEVPDPKAVKDLARSVRRIVESGLFPPILSLRHKELPPIHRPVLRILLLLSQAQTDAAEIEVREVLFDCGATFALEAADIALDTIVAEPSVASEQDLALIVSLMCQISRAPDAATSLLDKLQGSNIIPRSLEIIVRTRPVGDVLPPHLQTILLLHLAIASCGPTAEKLAMAGVLPAYADNVVAVAAEEARVDPDNESLHQAWCGILMVVKALLATLPNISSFARAEVVPLVRVVMPQLYRALAWGGETPLSRPVLDELSLAVDVFYGLAAALGAGPTAQADTLSLLDDFALPAIDLLRGVRFALSHPHRFCGLLVPATEDEQAALEKELATVEAQKDDINLVDAKLPTIAARTAEIVGIARTVLVTLAQLSHAWEILDGGAEPRAECLLGGEGDSPGGGALSASADPVGIVNDLYVLIGGLQVKLASSATTARETASQAVEAAGLLSLTQLLVRRALFPSPDDEPADDEMDEDDSTPGPAGIGGAGLARSTAGSTKPLGLGLSRRRSISMNSLSGKAHRAAQIRHELESDVRGMLGDNGGNPVLEIMRGIAVERFPE
jgi:nuclear pore complex protein Nup188